MCGSDIELRKQEGLRESSQLKTCYYCGIIRTHDFSRDDIGHWICSECLQELSFKFRE